MCLVAPFAGKLASRRAPTVTARGPARRCHLLQVTCHSPPGSGRDRSGYSGASAPPRPVHSAPLGRSSYFRNQEDINLMFFKVVLIPRASALRDGNVEGAIARVQVS